MDLKATFGDIDIYLFDQLLKGRFTVAMELLDAGCGGGRNLVYFLAGGFRVHGVDESLSAVRSVRGLAAQLAPAAARERFVAARLEALPYADARFDGVICNAVLHFARDEDHFSAMFDELWRVLAPGGVLFLRLASTIGLPAARLVPLGGRRYRLGDGSDRFLVDEGLLRGAVARLGAVPLDPLKTVLVEDLRAMSTWCLAKPAGHGSAPPRPRR